LNYSIKEYKNNEAFETKQFFGRIRMNGKTKKIVFDITALRVQGASKLQKAAVQALYYTAKESNAKTVPVFRRELLETGIALIKSRPTEPGLRTAVRIVWKASHQKGWPLDELRQSVLERCRLFSREREWMLEQIAEIGKEIIPRKAVVFTHCHSNTVEEMLKKSRKKIGMVYSTETRPLFQGRITATNLSKAGIPVTQIVDSAAASFIGKSDLFLTGADAILSNGNVVNKIGTREISLAAQKEKVPHLVATSSHAFDPLTVFGWREKIEERNWKEIWKEKPNRVKILNPAFDETPASQVKAIVSELGVLKPKEFVSQAEKELDLKQDAAEYKKMLRFLKK
jgi:ribose 1,5-bisphosphate isomerase